MTRAIVKVQVPLNAGAEALALVYDEPRKFQTQIPVTPELLTAMNGQPKQFFYAEFSEIDFELVGFAPWQRW